MFLEIPLAFLKIPPPDPLVNDEEDDSFDHAGGHARCIQELVVLDDPLTSNICKRVAQATLLQIRESKQNLRSNILTVAF